MTITQTVLISVSIICSLLYSVLRNNFSKKTAKTTSDPHFFNFMSSVICAVAMLAIMLVTGNTAISWFTIILVVLFGVATAVNSVTHLKALEVGPLSYTTLITTCSTFITALSGMFFFGEPSIRPIQYVGMGLIFACFVLSVIEKNENSKKANFKWFILTMVAMVSAAMIGILQKVHQGNAEHKDEIMFFLFLSFIVCAIFSYAFILVNKSRGIQVTVGGGDKKLWIIYVIAGLCWAANNSINLKLAGEINSVIFFPLVNGTTLIALILISVFMKEKLSIYKWIGIGVGIAGITLLCCL